MKKPLPLYAPKPENIPPALQGIEDLKAPRSFFCGECGQPTFPSGLIVPDVSPFGNPRYNEDGQLAVRYDCGLCGSRQNDHVWPWGMLVSFFMLSGFTSLLGLGCKFFLTGWLEIREYVGYAHGEFIFAVFFGVFGLVLCVPLIGLILVAPGYVMDAWRHRHRPAELRKQLVDAGWMDP